MCSLLSLWFGVGGIPEISGCRKANVWDGRDQILAVFRDWTSLTHEVSMGGPSTLGRPGHWKGYLKVPEYSGPGKFSSYFYARISFFFLHSCMCPISPSPKFLFRDKFSFLVCKSDKHDLRLLGAPLINGHLIRVLSLGKDQPFPSVFSAYSEVPSAWLLGPCRNLPFLQGLGFWGVNSCKSLLPSNSHSFKMGITWKPEQLGCGLNWWRKKKGFQMIQLVLSGKADDG